jgi:hypothetical protein
VANQRLPVRCQGCQRHLRRSACWCDVLVGLVRVTDDC